MRHRYVVYVSDDNGWLESCPDFADVFFGGIPVGGQYIPPDNSELGGHVEFRSRRRAERYLRRLNTSGDWYSRRRGKECRPEYDMAECSTAVECP